MQTPRLSTIAAFCLSLFLVWRILVSQDDEADLVNNEVEKKAIDQVGDIGKIAQEAHPHVHHHEHPVVIPPSQLTCGYQELAKNISSTPITMVRSADVVERCEEDYYPDRLRLFKPIDLPAPFYYDASYKDESSSARPDVAKMIKPGDLPETVHYVWCGKKAFRFQNYLSILSTHKLLQPHKIIFHYYEEPVIDKEWYNTWYVELKQSVSSLELAQSDTPIPCDNSEALLDLILHMVTSQEGGVYIGETTILTSIPHSWKEESAVVHPEDHSTPGNAKIGLIMSKPGFTLQQLKDETSQNAGKATTCRTIADFNQMETSPGDKKAAPCVVITMNVYPHEMLGSNAPMAAFARWLYYGKAKKATAEQSGHQVAPRIAHMVRWYDDVEFPFYGYLSILSALHIAGIEHLYVYGDKEPKGEYWTKVKHERVTFIHIDRSSTAFLQPVHDVNQMSDVMRYYILWKYGGVYMEYDTIWLKSIAEENWHYPAVVGVDWARKGDWPEYLSLGALMAKPGAVFLKFAMDKLKYFRADVKDFNSVLMAYRAYEQHPDSLHLDYKFQYSDKTQMICWHGVCHPAWRKINNNGTQTDNQDLSDFTAFHYKYPDVPPSLVSPETMKTGTDTFAQIGKMILEKSGKS